MHIIINKWLHRFSCINKNICLFRIHENKYFFSGHILENKCLSWAINALQCLIRNKTSHIFLDHINPLNADLNPNCHLLALLGAHHILHVSRIRVKKCNDNNTFSLVTIALNICEGNHLATLIDKNVLDIFKR
jgi:hypothetical protein